MFGSLGVPELLLILAVALIVFGPRKLPEVGRTLGKALGEFKKATDDLKNTIEREVRVEELRQIGPAALGVIDTTTTVPRAEPGTLVPAPDPVQPPVIGPASNPPIARDAAPAAEPPFADDVPPRDSE